MAKGKPWIAGGLLALIAAPILFYGSKMFQEKREPLSQRQIATRVMAEYLKQKIAPKKVLILSNPYTQRKGGSGGISSFQEAGEKGLQEGFGKNVQLKAVYPRLRAEALQGAYSELVDPQSATPLSFLTATESWVELYQANPGYDLAVSLIGVPLTYRELRKNPLFEKTPLALLLPDWRMIGQNADIRSEFASGRIAAAVINRPGANLETPPSSDYKKEFERLYLLVTPENAAQIFK